ncbi:SRPBCC family protein [Caldalkalibacillus salinus]|uniref:SRPBCC family protein n=1 Tax=Caldalkalibacillus salinus TaxID=2803787 RepID=UPI0030159F8F
MPAQVFTAWSHPEVKSQWFAEPDSFNFKVGGKETNQGGPPDGPVFTFEACYQDIVQDRRIVYTYTMNNGDTRISVSLVTVEFQPIENNGTRLTYTEQGVFLDGHDTPEIRKHGTEIMLDKLDEAVQSRMEREVVNTRVLHARREQILRAISEPEFLAQWWGPKGFTNTIQQFDMRPGGIWKYVMHGPDGKDHENKSEFIEVVRPQRIVLRHLEPVHQFFLTMTFVELDEKTELTWTMLFDTKAERDKVQRFVSEGNEQNFDKLEAILKEMEA